jgi:hypothetical protein
VKFDNFIFILVLITLFLSLLANLPKSYSHPVLIIFFVAVIFGLIIHLLFG